MRKRHPLQVAVLETTNRCNLNCLICGSDSKSQVNPNELTSHEWCKLIDELAEAGAEKIFFSGGEPTLKPGIGDIIEHTAKSGMRWGLISNGLYIPQSLLELFQERKPITIGLSLDGPADIHNMLRRNPESFQMVSKYIAEFRNREIPFSVITTIHKLNFRELFGIAEFVLENKIYGWQIQLAMPFGRMKQNQELLLSQEEFRRACEMIERIRKILPEVNVAAADCFAWAPAGKIRQGRWLGCSAGLESVGIDAQGNVKGCLSMTECEPEGNIRKQSFAKIWQDESLFAYNRCFDPANTSEFCQNCFKVMKCKGGCNSQSFSMTGEFQQGVYCWHKSMNKGGDQVEKRYGLQVRTGRTASAGA